MSTFLKILGVLALLGVLAVGSCVYRVVSNWPDLPTQAQVVAAYPAEIKAVKAQLDEKKPLIYAEKEGFNPGEDLIAIYEKDANPEDMLDAGEDVYKRYTSLNRSSYLTMSGAGRASFTADDKPLSAVSYEIKKSDKVYTLYLLDTKLPALKEE